MDAPRSGRSHGRRVADRAGLDIGDVRDEAAGRCRCGPGSTSPSRPLISSTGDADIARVFEALARSLTSHLEELRSLPVAPRALRADVDALLDALDETRARPLEDVLQTLSRASRITDIKTSHPRYFGLPSASPTALAIAGESLAAALSSQLATASHAPFAIESEQRLVAHFARLFAMGDDAGGQLTSGGQESNLTAMLLALHAAFPHTKRKGVRAIDGPPTVYTSWESHASLTKAARVLGLGDDAVRRIRVDEGHRMIVDDLRDRLARDRIAGCRPFLVVGTAGTTTAGAIDPLGELADLAHRERLSFHVDAAWGGLAALLPETRDALSGIERADTITFDPHKVLHVPLGAGMLLVKRPSTLRGSYAVSAPYMPRGNEGDPYASSLLWSRPFLGLRLLLPLATLGWRAHVEMARRRMTLGELLRRELAGRGFRLLAVSVLPVALFVPSSIGSQSTPAALARLIEQASRGAGAWLSMARLPGGERALRAGIVSHETTEADVLALASALELGAAS